MKGFLIGAIMGGLVAVLVAPRRGDETREIVRARVDHWQDQMMNKLDEARLDVQSLRHEMSGRFDDLRSQANRVTEEMKIRSNRMDGAAGESTEARRG